MKLHAASILRSFDLNDHYKFRDANYVLRVFVKGFKCYIFCIQSGCYTKNCFIQPCLTTPSASHLLVIIRKNIFYFLLENAIILNFHEHVEKE